MQLSTITFSKSPVPSVAILSAAEVESAYSQRVLHGDTGKGDMIAVLYIAHGRTGIEVTVEVIGADALHESIKRCRRSRPDRVYPQLHTGAAAAGRRIRPAGSRDIRRILPTGQSPLSRSYDGAVGVADTAEEGAGAAAARHTGRRCLYGRERQRSRCTDDLRVRSRPHSADGSACRGRGKLIQEEIRELSG